MLKTFVKFYNYKKWNKINQTACKFKNLSGDIQLTLKYSMSLSNKLGWFASWCLFSFADFIKSGARILPHKIQSSLPSSILDLINHNQDTLPFIRDFFASLYSRASPWCKQRILVLQIPFVPADSYFICGSPANPLAFMDPQTFSRTPSYGTM